MIAHSLWKFNPKVKSLLALLFSFHMWPHAFKPGFQCMSKMSGSNIQETGEDTARIEISCSVKGYQKYQLCVDAGGEFLIYKKIGSGERAFKVTNTRGQFDFVWLVLLVRKLNSQQNRCSIWFDCRTRSSTNRLIEFNWIFVWFCSIRYTRRTYSLYQGVSNRSKSIPENAIDQWMICDSTRYLLID